MLRRAFLCIIQLLSFSGSAIEAQQFTDSVPPTVSITTPASGATVRGRISINANACDNVGVAKVEFFVDGNLIGNDSTYPFSLSWSSKTVPNGSHSLTSKAFDAANNSATSQSVAITINNESIPPTTSITTPSNGSLLQGNVSITANATDNVAIERVEFYADSMLIGIDSTTPYNVLWDYKKRRRAFFCRPTRLTVKALPLRLNLGAKEKRQIIPSQCHDRLPSPCCALGKSNKRATAKNWFLRN